MRQLDVEVPVPEAQLEHLGTVAERLGVPLGDFLQAAAATYARRSGFGPARPGGTSRKRGPGWGERPAAAPSPETVHVRLGPEVLDLVEAARRAVRWEAPDGSTLPVTLEEYVLGAAERVLRGPAGTDATRLLRELFPGKGPPVAVSFPASAALAAPIGPPSSLKQARLLLFGAGGLTTIALVVAVVLAIKKPPPPPANPRTGPGVVVTPPPPSSEEDTGAAGKAVAQWEHDADAPASPAGSAGKALNHTQEIDKILKSHFGREKRDTLYDEAIDVAVRDVARVFPVPGALVKAIIRRESGFDPRAKSKAGAIGLMQLMPFNARKVGLSEADLWVPERNILGGTRFIAVLLLYYKGDYVAALAAYNAKPRNPFAPLPKNGETPEYVSVVLRYYAEYSRAAGTGLGLSPGSP